MRLLKDKVVIVTGVARGLGRAMAVGLVKEGCKVVGVDLPNQPEIPALVSEFGSSIKVVEVDLTDDAAADKIVATAIRSFGKVTGLINNAGMGFQQINPKFVSNPTRFWELTPKQWRTVMEVNATTQFLMARAVVKPMLAQGWGRIVNVTTSLATMTYIGYTPYGPSKAAVEAASAIWSKELAGTGVTVNVLIPGGPANTALLSDSDMWQDRSKLVQPAAMVAPAVYLMSDKSDGITGRRFLASEWNHSLSTEAAALLASTTVAWQECSIARPWSK